MLWTCLLLPALPLEVFARAQAPEDLARPFAVATGGHYPRIVAANAAASEAGIRPEMLVSATLALAPDLTLRDRDPALEAAALAAVATWATQFTPMVSVAPPDAIVAEIGGSLALFGGRSRLHGHFARGARELGYAARLAFAATPTAALVFARGDAATLDASRLAHLDVDPAAVATLAAAGITTFGEACALPRDALARRAGAAFVATLERARGTIPDPRTPFVPPPRYEGRLELPAAVDSVEALAFAVNRLVHELAGWLLGRGLGIVEMSLTLAHERHVALRSATPATAVRFALAAPAREPAHLIAVLRERLARVALPAPVVAIMLASEATAALAGRNLGLLPGAGDIATVPLVDRLRARLGEDAVVRVRPHPEHRPERAWKLVKVGGPQHAAPGKLPGKKSPAAPDRRTSAGAEALAALADSPRPAWLLAEPEPLGHHLETQPWVLRDGPERIESGWWDGADVRRDYFVAESPRGERVWIYRDHRYGADDGEWFLHGFFS
jgi:protein ImuB